MAGVASTCRETRSKAKRTLCDTDYVEAFDLPNGVLPSKKHVVECMLYLLRPARAGKAVRTKEDASKILASNSAIQDH